MHLNDLREKSMDELSKLAIKNEIDNASGMKKHELIFGDPNEDCKR